MTITVPVAKQEISAESFGIPVANEVNRMTPLVTASTSWVNLTLNSPWVSFGLGYAPLQYRRVGDSCQLRGTVKGGATPTPDGNNLLTTIPNGFRPEFNIMIVAIYGGTDGWGGFGRVDIQGSAGTIQIVVAPSGAMSGSHQLVGINTSWQIAGT